MSLRVLLLALGGASSAVATSYHFGSIWDGAKVWKDACISVNSGKIESVGPCAPNAKEAAIDMMRFTAIPGLIDAHTHLTYNLNEPIAQAARGAATVYLSQGNARKTLETGVTTVRNLGASDYADIAMRDLINNGLMVGPRMFVPDGSPVIAWPPVEPVPALRPAANPAESSPPGSPGVPPFESLAGQSGRLVGTGPECSAASVRSAESP